MSTNWKIVSQRRRKPAKPRRIYASLNRRGEISLNAEAFRLIGQPGSVTLLYDEPTHRIGVRYPQVADLEFFPVSNTGRHGKTLIIRAAGLLKQFSIQIERTVIFKNITIDKLNGCPMLVLDMKKSRDVYDEGKMKVFHQPFAERLSRDGK